jgi:putative mRNA 3-end processing factor
VVHSSRAERVLVTHGLVEPLVRWLNENGWLAAPLATPYRGELDENAETSDEADSGEEP